MGWNRSATLLSAIVFIAFGFMVIGVFSDPLSHNMLSIASKDGYDYGVLGFCTASSTSDTSSSSKGGYDCSAYGLGYKLHGSSWPASAETVTKIFIVHIIAAGILLISFFMALLSHFRNARFWVSVTVFLFLSCIAAALAFAVELYVFKTNLKFSGWFGLPAAVLSLVAGIAMSIMHRQLKAKLGRTTVDSGKDAFLSDPVGFHGDMSYNFGKDDEKFLKSKANIISYPLTNNANKPALMSNSSNRLSQPKGYQKIPENKSSSSSLGMQGRPHPLPLPVSSSTDSIGAVAGTSSNSLSQRGNPGTSGSSQQGRSGQSGAQTYGSAGSQGKYSQGQYSQGQSQGQYGQGQRSQGQSSQGQRSQYGQYGTAAAGSTGTSANSRAAGTGLGGVAAAGAVAGATAGAVGAAGTYDQRTTGSSNPSEVSRQNRQETWSQVALKKSQSSNLHASNASIATTDALHVPAGQYLNGFDKTERYGPNVVQIPKFRTGQAPAGESAVIEYHRDETQSKSPVSQSKIPNYSRMSAQEAGNNSPKGKSQPMTLTAPRTHAKKNSSESETSHYSERIPAAPSLGNVNRSGTTQASSTTQQPSSTSQQPSSATQQPSSQQGVNDYSISQYDQDSYQQQYAQYQYARMANANQQYATNQYTPNYAYDYSQGYNYNYSQGYDQTNYNNTAAPQSYNQPYQPSYYNQYNGGYGASPRKSGHPSRPQTSEVALMSNPDFSVGELGKKRRPNRWP